MNDTAGSSSGVVSLPEAPNANDSEPTGEPETNEVTNGAPAGDRDNLGHRPPVSVAIPELIDSMFANPEDFELQKRSLVSLKRLTSVVSDEARQLFGECGGIAVVVAALASHGMQNVKVALLCCIVLANSTFSIDDNQVRFRRARAGEAIVEAMRRHIDHADLQACACMAVRNAGSSENSNRRYLVSVGAAKRTTEALKRWGLVEKMVGEQGCAALGNIARGGLICQAEVRLVGGTEEIVRCLRSLDAGEPVIRHALMALRSVIMNNEKNQQHIGELGGVEIVVRVMAEHEEDGLVFKRGCEVLRFLACFEVNRGRLRDCGGALIIVKGLSNLKESPKVVTLSFQALSNLSYGHEGNKQLIVDSSGLGIILTKLEEYIGDLGVVENGLLLLRNLSDCSVGSRAKLIEKEVHMLVMEMMKKYEESPKVVEHGFALLLNMSECEVKILNKCGDDGENVEYVKDRLKTFPDALGLHRVGKAMIEKMRSLQKHEKSAGEQDRKTLFGLLRKLSTKDQF